MKLSRKWSKIYDVQITTMKMSVEEMESQRKQGLVILRASYCCEIQRGDSTTTEFITMDATTQLRFWVANGKLVGSAIPKSSWLGFYDLQAEVSSKRSKFGFKLIDGLWRRWKRGQLSQDRPASSPYLTIRYRNNSKVYELTIGEAEPFSLPCNDIAECLGDASIVT